MIKQNELRLGNYVFNDVSKIAEVEGISSTNNHCQLLTYELGGETEPYDWHEVFPIPLTEEWLLKLGFKQGTQLNYDRNVFYSTGGFKIDMQILKTSGFILLGEKMQRVPQPCEYVHQLQNLYFSLTGSELKISEGTATEGTAKN